jgi:hypothetical protein
MPKTGFKFLILYQGQWSEFDEEQDIKVVSEYLPINHLAVTTGEIHVMLWRNWPSLNYVTKMIIT